MDSKKFKSIALENLKGKWKTVALITLLYLLVFVVLSAIQNALGNNALAVLFSLGTAAINIPITYGYVVTILKLYNGENVELLDFLKLGFNNFTKAWGITLQILLKLLVPVIIIFVSYMLISIGIAQLLSSTLISYISNSGYSSAHFWGIVLVGFGILFAIISSVWATIKYYYYQLSYLVFAEDSSISCKDAVAKSRKLMLGKRSKLFVLQLSFIGWAILATLSFGIGFIWLLPYMQFATIAFYKLLTNNNNNEVVTEVNNENASN